MGWRRAAIRRGPGFSASTSAPSSPWPPPPAGARSPARPDRKEHPMYRIEIDRSLCSGFGACAELAPEIFELDGSGTAQLRVGQSDDPQYSRRQRPARWPRSGSSRRRRHEPARPRHRCRPRRHPLCRDAPRRRLRGPPHDPRREPAAPYERPALSKEYLAGTRRADQLLLRRPGFWDEHDIELRLGDPVAGVDLGPHVVATTSGALHSGTPSWSRPALARGASRSPYRPECTSCARSATPSRCAARSSRVPG